MNLWLVVSFVFNVSINAYSQQPKSLKKAQVKITKTFKS